MRMIAMQEDGSGGAGANVGCTRHDLGCAGTGAPAQSAAEARPAHDRDVAPASVEAEKNGRTDTGATRLRCRICRKQQNGLKSVLNTGSEMELLN